MKKIKLLSFLMVLLFSVPASAEFYRYTDKDGKVRYTDDYSKVPKSRRSSADKYRGYENNVTDEATESGETATEPDIQNPSESTQETGEGQESVTASKNDELDAAKKRLDKKQEEINKELDDLNRERSELDAQRTKIKNRPQSFEYKTKVEAFNEKVKNFQDKQKAFEAEVDAYNNELENNMKNSLKQFSKDKKAKEKM
ncbi:DUF4124 domain-containing protein [Desulfobacterium sp. N47]|uniref:DUF4124 domain-containing protein n=1 Tax=uncultured Desulfobacterium sp. TaxID=201089 RepID=E1YIJ2_9BACT|nr:hypothetical protein N47_D28480 [uncultured Desulfobacterium sp.]